ncbi:MAG TPA: ABC transporter permease [Acidimicrobiales bacterium]|nr:ABC transporter permease [Acidimicrobiales bacterium]
MKAFFSNRLAMVGLGIIVFFGLVALFAPLIAPYSPTDINFTPFLPISSHHWLGTTSQGNDIFSQLVYGARSSLMVGLATAAIITVIQLFMGIFSGYVGGWVDNVLNTVTNIFLVVPALVLLIILAAYLPGKGLGVIVAILAATGWAWGARVLRAQAISLRDRSFVEAARMSGESRWRIVLGHVVPNMFGILAANFFGAALYAILAEAGLEFLGLGNINDVTWGVMLYWGENTNAMLMGQWLFLLLPGFCILLLGTGFGLLNFAVDQVANPRLRRN